MANLPQFYPYQQNFMPNVTVPSNTLKFIQGGDATAKAYPVAPGDTVVLMDTDESFIYIKSVGFNGVPNPLRKFKYEEVFEQPKEDIPVAKEVTEYVTKQDFDSAIDKLTGMIASMQKPNYERRGDKNAKSNIRRDE